MRVNNPNRKSDEEPDEIKIDYSFMTGTAYPITTWSKEDKVRKDIKDKRIYGFIRPKENSTD